MSKTPALRAILERVKPGGRRNCFKLWFCTERGAACEKQMRLSKHCSDCIDGRDDETLGELEQRIRCGGLQ